jgi:hypothetical protein
MYDKIRSDCRHLKTKMSFIPDPGNRENWRSEDSTTHQYWCARTMLTAGPDNGLVAPQECGKGRSCYVDKFKTD